ncbi:MAG: hypothetical protein AAF657_05885 [Acidobacteriota bacterium]
MSIKPDVETLLARAHLADPRPELRYRVLETQRGGRWSLRQWIPELALAASVLFCLALVTWPGRDFPDMSLATVEHRASIELYREAFQEDPAMASHLETYLGLLERAATSEPARSSLMGFSLQPWRTTP